LSSQPHNAPTPAPEKPSLVHPVTPGPQLLETAAGTLRMLAEPTRLNLLFQLTDGPKTVTDLTSAAGVPGPLSASTWPNSASAAWSTPAKTAATSSTPSTTGTSSG
jgi:hypothetical protein